MAKYKVRIVEYLSKIVEVDASSEEMAERIVKDRYFDEEIVLDYGDFDDVEFELYNED
jgi:hypothetical protein